MMHKTHPYCHCARITLEAVTPVSIKADELDPTLDTRLVRDAHGLPTLPGTSLAGVTRHLYQQQYGQEAATKLFGQETLSSEADALQASRVRFSFGYVHNQHNQPVRGPVDQPRSFENDPLLSWLQDISPILRDHVKLNEYGVAEDKAKADRSALPRGTRFTFEVQLLSETPDTSLFSNLLELFCHPLFRIGGLTHRGFGAVKPVALHQKSFNFTTPDNLTAWKAWRNLPWEEGMQTYPALDAPNCTYFSLVLEAEDFWRIGQGDTPLGNYAKAPDLLPYHEKIIQWENNTASLKDQIIVVPASGIKGALRHRTVFHYLRLTGGQNKTDYQQAQHAIAPLFGEEVDHKNNQGGYGALVLDDIYLETTPQTTVQPHIAIDRFTGGVKRGALFTEELLWKGHFTLQGWLTTPKALQADPQLAQAFRLAIDDLSAGRINLGAEFARGHGFFKARQHNLTALDQLIGECSS